MDYTILVRCFFIGVLASSSVGPIFILTFNRGAIYGFFRGFATALGACIADGIYFFLGLFGVLSILQESRHFMFFLDTIGGILLIFLGIYSIKKSKKEEVSIGIGDRRGVFLSIGKSFMLTIVNPLVFLFFLFIGIQILPEGVETLTFRQILFASFMVVLGSLTILSIVAFIASRLGKLMKRKQLKLIYFITGMVFIGVGIYFLDHLFFLLLS